MKKLKIITLLWFSAILILWGFNQKPVQDWFAGMHFFSKSLPAKEEAPTRYYFFGSPHTANNRWVMGPGEYNNSVVDNTTHRLYLIQDYPQAFAGLPDSFATTAGGAHHFMAITLGGRLAGWGDNAAGELGIGSTVGQNFPVFVSTDSLGNQFGNVKKVGCGGAGGSEPWNTFAVKKDGTLWACGDLSGGLRGNGTFGGQTNRFVQIPFPAGTFIVDAYLNFSGLALDSAGNVWTWGANYGFYPPYLLAQGTANPVTSTPTKIILPARCKQIAGGSSILSYYLLTDGTLYGSAWNISYMGLPIGGSQVDMSYTNFKAWRIDTALKLQAPIDTLVVNGLSTLAILTDSTLWGWGSNACGNFGIGAGIDFRHYTTPGGTYAPYNWDQGQGEAMQIKPVRIMNGKHNFTKIFGSTALNFFWNVEDVNDSIYVFGRNKGGIIPNNRDGIDSVAGDLAAYYPNNWDVNYATYVDLFRSTKVIRTTCQLFIDSAGAYLESTYPLNTSGTAPVVSAGSTQNISTSYTTLKGSYTVSAPASGAYTVFWQNTARPAGAPIPIMPLVANDTVSVANLTVIGAYTFSYTVRDNNFKSTTASVVINVTAGGASSYFTKHRGAFRVFKNSH